MTGRPEVTQQVRVLLHHRAPTDRRGRLEPGNVLEAYHRVSAAMATVPGMVGNELLRSLQDPSRFVVVSRWADMDAFTRWEQSSGHGRTTAPLRPFRDPTVDPPFGIYVVEAAYL